MSIYTLRIEYNENIFEWKKSRKMILDHNSHKQITKFSLNL
jgi:hypothetical protein